MNEPTFITREHLEEIKKNSETSGYYTDTDVEEIRKQIQDFIYTLDKMYLGIDACRSVLENLADIKLNDKEAEQERWKKLGEDLKQIRTEHEISLNSLAGILDTTWANLDNAERGLIDPTEYLREATATLNKE